MPFGTQLNKINSNGDNLGPIFATSFANYQNERTKTPKNR
jgi:hypothetical protein